MKQPNLTRANMKKATVNLLKACSQIVIGMTVGFAFMSPANATDVKQSMINKCVEDTVNYKVADNQTAQKFCDCTVNVRGKMTFDQMWLAESYAQSNKDPMTLPFIKQMQKDLEQCTVGLKLNPPQKPE